MSSVTFKITLAKGYDHAAQTIAEGVERQFVGTVRHATVTADGAVAVVVNEANKGTISEHFKNDLRVASVEEVA